MANPDGTIDLLPTAAAAAEAAKKKAAEEAERGKPLSAAQKEVAVQCFALKLLSGGLQGVAGGMLPGGMLVRWQSGFPACESWACLIHRVQAALRRPSYWSHCCSTTRTFYHPMQTSRSCTSTAWACC